MPIEHVKQYRGYDLQNAFRDFNLVKTKENVFYSERLMQIDTAPGAHIYFEKIMEGSPFRNEASTRHYYSRNGLDFLDINYNNIVNEKKFNRKGKSILQQIKGYHVAQILCIGAGIGSLALFIADMNFTAGKVQQKNNQYFITSVLCFSAVVPLQRQKKKSMDKMLYTLN